MLSIESRDALEEKGAQQGRSFVSEKRTISILHSPGKGHLAFAIARVLS